MLQSDNSTLNFLYAIGAHSDCSECAPFFINMRFSVIGIPFSMIGIQSLISIIANYQHFTSTKNDTNTTPYDNFTMHKNAIDDVTL